MPSVVGNGGRCVPSVGGHGCVCAINGKSWRI